MRRRVRDCADGIKKGRELAGVQGSFPRSAWECRRGGSASCFQRNIRQLRNGDAERHRMHSHAERGNDHLSERLAATLSHAQDRSHAPRGNAAEDALRPAFSATSGNCAVVTRSVTGCIPTRSEGTIISAKDLPRRSVMHKIVPTLRVGMPPRTLCVMLSVQHPALAQW